MRTLPAALAALALVAVSCTASPAPPKQVFATSPAPTAAPTAPAAKAPSIAAARPTTVAEIARRASDVPSPLTQTSPETLSVSLETREVVASLADATTYAYWTFGGTVPGPFVRVRVGDTIEFHLKNAAGSTMPHSIDLHAVTGPGGGSGATQTGPGQEKSFTFKALNPGLFVYHCATAPIDQHIANGMYGMILVEPVGGLPKVDREYYVMQGELYTNAPVGTQGHHEFSFEKMVAEQPDYVLFNGRVGALTGANALKAKVGERVRLYVGVGGFVPSSFHVIGEIFDRVYPEGAIGSEPQQNVQTTFIPAGGAAIVEFTVQVPGTYLLVDHTLTRSLDKGALGQLVVEGPEDPSIYRGAGGSGH